MKKVLSLLVVLVSLSAAGGNGVERGRVIDFEAAGLSKAVQQRLDQELFKACPQLLQNALEGDIPQVASIRVGEEVVDQGVVDQTYEVTLQTARKSLTVVLKEYAISNPAVDAFELISITPNCQSN